MTAKRKLGLIGACLALLATAALGRHYYETLRHLILGERPHAAFRTNDLYNASEHLFKRGRRDLPEVCLTIDDGPHPQSLPQIIRILDEYKAKATFFMVGRRIEQHPELVREALRHGFEVGNHTENHPRLSDLPPDQIRAEIALCQSNFERATGGTKLTLFRPPGMRCSPLILKIAREFGYTTVDWNYGAKDFIEGAHGPFMAGGERNIVEYVLENVTPGGIILLHDGPETAEALPAILQGLAKKGLAVKDVTEMMEDLPKPVYVETNAGQLGKLAMK